MTTRELLEKWVDSNSSKRYYDAEMTVSSSSFAPEAAKILSAQTLKLAEALEQYESDKGCGPYSAQQALKEFREFLTKESKT
jgi:hypothetical protein